MPVPEYDNLAICGQGQVRTVERVRYRREPGLQGTPIGTWGIGEDLDVWAQVGDWLLVQHEDRRLGWTHKGFVTTLP